MSILSQNVGSPHSVQTPGKRQLEGGRPILAWFVVITVIMVVKEWRQEPPQKLEWASETSLPHLGGTRSESA